MSITGQKLLERSRDAAEIPPVNDHDEQEQKIELNNLLVEA